MTIFYLTYALAALSGGLAVYGMVWHKLDQLRRLTDRDERGRFVKREKR